MTNNPATEWIHMSIFKVKLSVMMTNYPFESINIPHICGPCINDKKETQILMLPILDYCQCLKIQHFHSMIFLIEIP